MTNRERAIMLAKRIHIDPMIDPDGYTVNAITAALDQVRAESLEEAAKVCDRQHAVWTDRVAKMHTENGSRLEHGRVMQALVLSHMIRALIGKGETK